MEKDTTEIQRRIELIVTNGLGYESIAELAKIIINPKDCYSSLKFHLNDLSLRDYLSLEKESKLVRKFRLFYEKGETPRIQLNEVYFLHNNHSENYEYEYDQRQTDGTIRRAIGIGCR